MRKGDPSWHGRPARVWRYSATRSEAIFLRLFAYTVLLSAIAASTGCTNPSAANIELRKKNQELTDQIDSLTRTHQADQATIRGLQNHNTVPTLPTDRLDKLFTVHGLQLGRLTGGADLDRNKPGDEGLKIYAFPTDDDGDPIKAAGSFTIEAFDLAAKPPEIGKWPFDLETTRKAWIGQLLSHDFVLTCPWQQLPMHEELTVKVTFRDELTGREFHAQTVVKIKLPPANSAALSR